MKVVVVATTDDEEASEEVLRAALASRCTAEVLLQGKEELGNAVRSAILDKAPDLVLIVGGDGLTEDQRAPEVVGDVCGGRLLGGVAEVAYKAAGFRHALFRRGVAGLHPNGRTVVSCFPRSNAHPAFAALLPLLWQLLPLTNTEHAVLPPPPPTAHIDPGCVVGRPRKSTFLMMEMPEALACIEQFAPQPGPACAVSVANCQGLVCANDVKARVAHPPFRASIKDGYAVRASECPGDFEVSSFSVVAGDNASGLVLPLGTVCRVSTGGAVPAGADAVVQVEDTEILQADAATDRELRVRIRVKAAVGQDIRPEGSDIEAGSILVPHGTVLGPAEVGLLSSTGAATVRAHKRVTVAVISTGNEVVSPGVDTRDLQAGQVFDSNTLMLAAAAREQGCDVIEWGVVKDEAESVTAAIGEALAEADIVITSGGASMGEKDFVKQAFLAHGATVHFGRVEMKPGKPTTFATSPSGKALVGLPGNPVSCLVCFHLFVVPIIRKRSGCPRLKWHHPIVPARLGGTVGLRLDRERPEYHRVSLEFGAGDPTTLVATSTGRQISSRLLSMLGANALLCLPKGSASKPTAQPGEMYQAVLFGKL
ncbi:Molybdopterin biosynthesis protein CNX1 [Diplonema papillatum]|nr:Molybdopterin biosynthesis protein CNX1 [Diplonema papillatum]